MLIPSETAPDLSLPLIGGGTWTLSERSPENFTVLYFYRGLHCPVCKAQLSEVKRALDRFVELGVEVAAASMDAEDRAHESYESWRLDPLTVAYGLTEADARAWGLYISEGRAGTSEPARFSEPGMFVLTPARSLYYVSVQSMPFARPPVDGVLGGLKYIIENDYPARGTLAA
ncbi:MAG: peroxiredoxin-like family protein [Pseudomonadota bacterium]